MTAKLKHHFQIKKLKIVKNVLLQDYNTGMYFLRIESNNKVTSRKIVKI